MRRTMGCIFAIGLMAVPAASTGASHHKYDRVLRAANDPGLLGGGFATVITMALVEAYTGRSYADWRNGDLEVHAVKTPPGQPPGAIALCTAEEAPDPWLKEDLSICRPASVRDDGPCRQRDGCAAIFVDPSLLQGRNEHAIIRAVENPCATLIEPKRLGSQPEAQARSKGLYLSYAEAWALFRCKTRTPIRASVTGIDRDRGVIQISF